VELLVLTLLMTVLGAFTNVLLWIRSWGELTSFEATRTLVLGLVVGVLWYFMRVEHNVPDSVVSFVVGYAARDIIEAVVQRFRPGFEGTGT
jgi:prepilin signal peptidase PulO-like enzyme (type II secretory pathway)